MIIRDAVPDDIEELKRIAESYSNNPLPDKFQTSAVIERNGKVIAFGATRVILEGLFYGIENKRDRVIALKELLNVGYKDAEKLGFDQLYVFVDLDFVDILRKHFGFKVANGICMVKDL